jgi:drug/metabolite transporter (DMT)-like permease
MVSADRLIDLIEAGVDVAIRLGKLNDSSHRAVPIGDYAKWLVASPGFVARHALPGDLRDAAGSLAAPAASPVALGAVLMLGVFPAALGYASWTVGLGYFGAARASSFLYLVPAVATALSMGERPGVSTLAGGVMAIVGVALVAWRGRR